MKDISELLCSKIVKSPGQVILNLGSGKEEPLDLPEKPYVLVNLDSGYYEGTIDPGKFVEIHRVPYNYSTEVFMIKEDAFEFMERHPFKFDRIVMYRFLEHIKRVNVLYFIYLVATSIKPGGFVDCIVPNYESLAKRVLEENPFAPGFEAEDIITTYEIVNEPEGPHASIWTPKRIKWFFELEKRFTVIEYDPEFNYDGRNIYLRALIKRV